MAEKIPATLKYTKDHEWAQIEGNVATIGITHHAQDALGEVVFVELPAQGRELKKGDTFGVVESIKAVSDLYSPLTGKVLEVNKALTDEPGHANTDPYGNAWMIKLELSDSSETAELLAAEDYKKIVDSL
ncbi:MAG: glycine cleavage system protein GcvH [Proteobacteria bacterium]|nr:MAG: glycine cleavage system protein GcvH [Pseudomonadota bacterium]